MSTIPVELPDELHEFVDLSVQRGQFASANDYIVALIDAARSKRSEIEAALIEGLDSGSAEEWTSQEWADIRQRVIDRHQKG
jgi:putative addiction module CopG family antidote